MQYLKPKIVVILGPTATDKSSLAVKVAQKFNGEAVSADSRQVYRGLDIGTGKITKKEMRGVEHHLLDVVEPNEAFDVVQYRKLAEEKINEILRRGKLPILVGGTGFYIQSIVEGLTLPEVPPNEELRERLQGKSIEKLSKILEGLSLKSSNTINRMNKRRLIRVIEIVKALGEIPAVEKDPKYDCLQIGLDLPDEELKERIYKRLIGRINEGMLEEGERVEKEIGLTRMKELGLEYKYLAEFQEGKLSKEEMVEELNKAVWRYAKRQRTWFKRDGRINWFKPSQREEIFKVIEKFANIPQQGD